MPELIVDSLAAYEETALKFAREPQTLAAVKAKLARQHEAAPAFDTRRFARNLESAFTVMHERHQQGLPPASFSVTAPS
jgi:predicted O-linked N-acetylglucosamine transferase (SPINDLY family)